MGGQHVNARVTVFANELVVPATEGQQLFFTVMNPSARLRSQPMQPISHTDQAAVTPDKLLQTPPNLRFKDFELDPSLCSAGLQLLSNGCVARKRSDENPEYSTVLASSAATFGCTSYWETRIDQVGNIRLGVVDAAALQPDGLNAPLYDPKAVGGSAWFVDYDGLICTTDLSTDSGKVVGNMERPLQQGDRVGLELDLIVGKLTVYLNGVQQSVVITEGLPSLEQRSKSRLCPAWCLNNEDEQFMLISATTLTMATAS